MLLLTRSTSRRPRWWTSAATNSRSSPVRPARTGDAVLLQAAPELPYPAGLRADRAFFTRKDMRDAIAAHLQPQQEQA